MVQQCLYAALHLDHVVSHLVWQPLQEIAKMAAMAVADLRGGARDTRPPWGPKFFQFHAVFGKIWQNLMLAPPPGELAPPPRGNPGSATAWIYL